MSSGSIAILLFFPLTQHPWRHFPGGSGVKNLPADAGAAGDASLIPGVGKGPGLIPELRRSPGGGNDNPLQYPCLGSHKDGLSTRACTIFTEQGKRMDSE